MKQDRNDQALQDLNKAIYYNEKYPQAFFKRGETNLNLKNFDDAIKDYQEAQKLDSVKFDMTENIQKAKAAAKRSKKKDYYAILEIKQDATEEDVKKSYKKLALKWHPDRVHDPELRPKAEQMFKDISEAYQVLTDKDKRRKYDLGQDLDGPDFGGFDGAGFNPFDLFKNMFHGGGMSSGDGDDMPGGFSFGGGGPVHFVFSSHPGGGQSQGHQQHGFNFGFP